MKNQTNNSTPVFVNLTNHPSSKWSEEQKNAALSKASKIVDVEFPNVDPCLSAVQVQVLAEKTLDNILDECKEKNQSVRMILVQGEFSFVHSFIQYADYLGVDCCCATTERTVTEVEENGITKKTVIFKFVQFRRYT